MEKDNIALGIYSLALFIWLGIWAVLLLKEGLCVKGLLLLPFFAGLGYLVFTGLHAWLSPLEKDAEGERHLLRWLTDYLSAFIFAITLIMLFGVYLCQNSPMNTIKDNPSLLSFYRFEFISLGFVLLFVFPAYWFSERKIKWFRAVRHVKTASYLIAIFFCLAGFIELARFLLG